MLFQLGLLAAHLCGPAYQELLASTNTESLSPFALVLQELKEEIYKVPSREEYVYFLEGEVLAIQPFASAYGNQHERQYNKLLRDFHHYQENPSLPFAQRLDKDIQDLLTADYPKDVDLRLAMQNALTTLETEVQKLDISHAEKNLKLLGEESALFLLADRISDKFDEEFDLFDDLFDAFMVDPSPENQEKMLNSLRQLRINLT